MLYHHTHPKQLVTERENLPVAYLPLGVLEWHGYHNPLGLDGVKAESALKYLCEKLDKFEARISDEISEFRTRYQKNTN